MTKPGLEREILLESGTNEFELVNFLLAEQHFGVNVAKVRQIQLYDAALLTELPGTHDWVLGAYTFQGKTVLLLDLGAALQRRMSPREGERPLVLVTELLGRICGFRVDGVEGIHRCSWSALVPLNPALTQLGASFTGSVSVGDQEVFVVDLEQVLAEISPGCAVGDGESTPSPDATSPAELPDRSSLSVLFAEDSPLVRRAIVRKLAVMGYERVEVFENGRTAFDTLRGRGLAGVDVIVSDIEMPEMDGLTFCRRFREDLGARALPFVFFSSLIDDQMKIKCEAVGGTRYATKPNVDELVRILDSFCPRSVSGDEG